MRIYPLKDLKNEASRTRRDLEIEILIDETWVKKITAVAVLMCNLFLCQNSQRKNAHAKVSQHTVSKRTYQKHYIAKMQCQNVAMP